MNTTMYTNAYVLFSFHIKASNTFGESSSSNLLVFTPGKKAADTDDDDDLSHPDDDPDSSQDRSGIGSRFTKVGQSYVIGPTFRI